MEEYTLSLSSVFHFGEKADANRYYRTVRACIYVCVNVRICVCVRVLWRYVVWLKGPVWFMFAMKSDV